ncbi:TPA: hypothetical protein OXK14_000636 [Acinetobacter baumannii]|nr:hypothetical protein [Acinetobacter baumannii]HCW6209594.1 hypothetical protein [Acinetobacter baumannii]HCW6224553.1 hypothetical protein [Acinetobacter baumannii]
MTDLNKEREAFERLPLAELAIKSEFVYYNEETNSYWPNEDFCPSDAPETMNFAWEAWQEKAKAQAVPDTHIVVPKQPTPKMIDATWDFDEEIIEMSSNTRNEFIWKKMVEASESGAEG